MELKTKICTKCNKRKLISTFGKKSDGKGGFAAQCKKCAKIYHRKYYQVHKIKIIKSQKKYRKTIKGYLIFHFHYIKRRCNNPKDKDYKYYGGRGIKCLFKNSQAFVDYVINELKIDPRGLTIDRIDNDGHYECGNIRFVTQAENNKNKRKNYGTDRTD